MADIRVTDGRFLIDGFSTKDGDIVSYFGDAESAEASLLGILKLGIAADRSVNLSKNVNYVDAAFASFQKRVDTALDSAFSKDGKLNSVLFSNTERDVTMLRDLLNPNKEGAPLNMLKSELYKTLAEIRDAINRDAGQREVIEKSPQKGYEFEQACADELAKMAKMTSDVIADTSMDRGAVTDSKKGDFTSTLQPSKRRMVFEIKDRSRMSLPDILRELDAAMENREADYGIFVAKSMRTLPAGVGWFNEYGGNKLLVATSDENAESVIGTEMIHIAYKWARARMAVAPVQSRTDPKIIRDAIKDVEIHLGTLRKINRQCGNIETANESIRENSRSVEAGIKKDIERVIKSLTEHGD